MLIKILLIVAIVIQTIATLFAIRLIRTTKYNSIWILFTIGFTLLSVEGRAVPACQRSDAAL